ncbi:MAG TPA: hypothetical protein VFW66_03190 [Gemmatimonadales bacterium]|nr:hypothetical protein [Gemmatimonadales bacterium]
MTRRGMGALAAALYVGRRWSEAGPGEPPRHAGRLARIAFVIGIVGLVLSALGLLVDARQAYTSFLTAYAAAISVALGALILAMSTHLTGARWFIPLRRVTEGVAATMPVFAILFILLLPGLGELYPWVRSSAGVPAAAYLNVPFFVIRAVIYFAIWITITLLLDRWSAERARAPAPGALGKSRALSAAGLPLVSLALTFAAFDWLMSLAPRWFSTIYGLYWFSGGFLGALALVALAGCVASGGTLAGAIESRQYRALGTLLVTFIVFWAYIAFCQFLIIWIGDIPVEIAWYVPRMRGSWGVLAVVLIVGQFALPFLLLLPRAVKTNRTALGVIAVWLLVMHYLDVYWLVLPALHPDGIHPHWLDLTGLAAVVGLTVAYGAWRIAGQPLLPRPSVAEPSPS